jgi:hypothetical protein
LPTYRVTNGYGQTLLALVSAAGAVGAASIAERLLDPEVAQELHVNTASKELVGSFMRKLIASGQRWLLYTCLTSDIQHPS